MPPPLALVSLLATAPSEEPPKSPKRNDSTRNSPRFIPRVAPLLPPTVPKLNESDSLMLEQLESQVSSLRQTLSKSEEAIKTKDELLRLFEDRCRRDQRGLEEERSQHRKTVVGLRENISAQQSHIEAMRKEVASLTESKARENKARRAAEEQVADLSIAVGDAKQQVNNERKQMSKDKEKEESRTKQQVDRAEKAERLLINRARESFEMSQQAKRTDDEVAVLRMKVEGYSKAKRTESCRRVYRWFDWLDRRTEGWQAESFMSWRVVTVIKQQQNARITAQNREEDMQRSKSMMEKAVRERVDLEAKLKQTEHEFTVLRRHREKLTQELEVYRRQRTADIAEGPKALYL